MTYISSQDPDIFFFRSVAPDWLVPVPEIMGVLVILQATLPVIHERTNTSFAIENSVLTFVDRQGYGMSRLPDSFFILFGTLPGGYLFTLSYPQNSG